MKFSPLPAPGTPCFPLPLQSLCLLGSRLHGTAVLWTRDASGDKKPAWPCEQPWMWGGCSVLELCFWSPPAPEAFTPQLYQLGPCACTSNEATGASWERSGKKEKVRLLFLTHFVNLGTDWADNQTRTHAAQRAVYAFMPAHIGSTFASPPRGDWMPHREGGWHAIAARTEHFWARDGQLQCLTGTGPSAERRGPVPAAASQNHGGGHFPPGKPRKRGEAGGGGRAGRPGNLPEGDGPVAGGGSEGCL